MTNKLENLISFDDFKSNWKSENSKTTKRTQTGLDILKENYEDEDVADVDRIDEIIPEGLPEDVEIGEDEKIEEILEYLENDIDEDVIDALVNDLRETLLEMEQQGFVDSDTTDELDDKHDGDWISWIKDVIELPDFNEDALNGILDIISNAEDYPNYSDEEEVKCPDCEGTGLDENGEECERCWGEGRVNRPDDIPPDE